MGNFSDKKRLINYDNIPGVWLVLFGVIGFIGIAILSNNALNLYLGGWWWLVIILFVLLITMALVVLYIKDSRNKEEIKKLEEENKVLISGLNGDNILSLFSRELSLGPQERVTIYYKPKGEANSFRRIGYYSASNHYNESCRHGEKNIYPNLFIQEVWKRNKKTITLVNDNKDGFSEGYINGHINWLGTISDKNEIKKVMLSQCYLGYTIGDTAITIIESLDASFNKNNEDSIERRLTSNKEFGNKLVASFINSHEQLYIKEYELAQVITKHKDNLSADEVNESDKTGLHYAAYHGDIEAIKSLISSGIDINGINKSNITPLHCAAIENHTEAIELLIDKGANVNAVNRNNITPLHCAALKGHTEAVKRLIDNGANVNAPGIYNITPLHCAVLESHTGVIEQLIDNKANVNAVNKGSVTPLHWAALRGHTEVVKLLIDNEANINAVNKGNITPLHWATYYGHLKVVKLLVRNKANINAVDKNNNTPLDLVIMNIRYIDVGPLLKVIK